MESGLLYRGSLWMAGLCTLGLSACAHLNGDRAADAGSAPRTAQTGRSDSSDPRMQLQARMLEMHSLMHRIDNAKDPEERQRLQQQQARLIQENMEIMMPLMLSIIHQGTSQGGGIGPGEDPCAGDMGSGTSGGQGGGVIILPQPGNAPGPTLEDPGPEETQRNS